jgi:hypothetical protein
MSYARIDYSNNVVITLIFPLGAEKAGPVTLFRALSVLLATSRAYINMLFEVQNICLRDT